MARHPKTTLWMLIKIVLKKRYARVEKTANGGYIPAVKGPYLTLLPQASETMNPQ
jgi:hypothetical protein